MAIFYDIFPLAMENGHFEWKKTLFLGHLLEVMSNLLEMMAIYPPVMTNIANWKMAMSNGNIHYFNFDFPLHMVIDDICYRQDGYMI